jgi:hypothetical protein
MSNVNPAGHHASKWFLLPGTGEHMGCAPTQPRRHRLLPLFIYNTMSLLQTEVIRHQGALRHLCQGAGTKAVLDLEEKCSERSW